MEKKLKTPCVHSEKDFKKQGKAIIKLAKKPGLIAITSHNLSGGSISQSLAVPNNVP